MKVTTNASTQPTPKLLFTHHQKHTLLRQLGIDPNGVRAKLLLAQHGDSLCETLLGRHALLTIEDGENGSATIQLTPRARNDSMESTLPAGFPGLARALSEEFPLQSLSLLRAACQCPAASAQIQAAVEEAYAMARQASADVLHTTETAPTTTTTTTTTTPIPTAVTTTTTTQTTKLTRTTTITERGRITTTLVADPQPPLQALTLSSQTLAVQRANKEGPRELAAAIASDDPEKVREVLALAALLNKALEDGSTPLQLSVRLGKKKVLDLLMKHPDLDPNQAGADGWTPLHEAVVRGNKSAVSMLLKHPGIRLNIPLPSGATPFYCAIEYRQLDMAVLLHNTGLKLLLTKPVNINAAINSGFTPLHIACAKGDLKAVAWLLKQPDILLLNGAPRGLVAVLQHTTDNGTTLLQLAARSGNTQLVKFLVNGRPGIELNRANKEGWTPLLEAIEAQQADVVAFLLAQPNIRVDTKLLSGATPFLLAVEVGQLEMAKGLYAKGADVHEPMENGVTPLHRVCKNGHKAIARWLMALPTIRWVKGKQHDVAWVLNQVTSSGATPLLMAAAAGQGRIVQWLLTQDGIDPNRADHQGMTPLHAAAKGGHVDIATELLAMSNIFVSRQQSSEPTPLFLAVVHHHFAIAGQLLWRGADIHTSTEGGETLLHRVCSTGDREGLEWLLKEPAIFRRLGLQVDKAVVLNMVMEDGSTPLLLAARGGHWDTVEFLLRMEGVNPGVADRQGTTLLHLVARTHHVDLADLLLMRPGVRVNAELPQGNTLLLIAVQHNQLEMAEFLLGKGADIHQHVRGGITPLHAACRKGHLGLTRWLLERPEIRRQNGRLLDMPSVLNQATLDGETLLHLAVGSGNEKLVGYLLTQDGIDCNPLDVHGQTLLHVVAHSERLDIALLLLQQRPTPDINSRTRRGLTAIHIAIEHGQWKMAKQLLRHGADINRTTANGSTLLHQACLQKSVDHVLWLLKRKGIHADMTDAQGMTMLHVAALAGRMDLVPVLLEHPKIDALMPGPYGFNILHFAVMSPQPMRIVRAVVEALPPEDAQSLADSRDSWNTRPASLAAEFGCDLDVIRALSVAPVAKPVPFQPMPNGKAWIIGGPLTPDGRSGTLADVGRAAGIAVQTHGDGIRHPTWADLHQLKILPGDLIVCQLRGTWNGAQQRMMLELGGGEMVPLLDMACLFFERGVFRALFVGLDPTLLANPLRGRFQNDPYMRRPVDSNGGHAGFNYTFMDSPFDTSASSNTEAVDLWFKDCEAERRQPGTGRALRVRSLQSRVVLDWDAARKAFAVEAFLAPVAPVSSTLKWQHRRPRKASS